jgi:transcriptional regulator with XRE-family HTH domain
MRRQIAEGLPGDTILALQEIGAAIGRARRARGETQRMAAERIGAHPQTISRLERGDPGVSAGSLLALLKLYGHDKAVWSLAEDTEQTQLLAMRLLQRPSSRNKST